MSLNNTCQTQSGGCTNCESTSMPTFYFGSCMCNVQELACVMIIKCSLSQSHQKRQSANHC